jgi:DNA-binding transcriptional LysR family regulator
MPSRDLDLRDLTAFAAVAQKRNFRRAAAELRISPAALSENIQALEERLGVRLLHRTTRSVAPTEAGERLLTKLIPALRDVADAVSDIKDRRDLPAGRLRINAPTPAVSHVLVPMVGTFLKRYPDIRLEIIDTSDLIDIVAEGFDAGIRYQENLARDMIAVSLGPPQRYVVVASPHFLDTRDRPTTPADLISAPCIVVRFPTGVILPWEFEKDGRQIKFVPEGRLVCMNTDLRLQSAIDGLGFLMTFERDTLPAVKAGELEVVLDDWCPPFPGPFLYYPSRRHPPPALAAFIQFVAEWRTRAAEKG